MPHFNVHHHNAGFTPWMGQDAGMHRRPADPYAQLRGRPLPPLTPPAKDFYGKPVPGDLLKAFKPDNINQYHQFLKALMFGCHDTARKIKASHDPGEWERLGRRGVPNFNASYWAQRGGRQYVEQFVAYSVQKAYRSPAAQVRHHRSAFQHNLYNAYANRPVGHGAKAGVARQPAPKPQAAPPTPFRPTWLTGNQRKDQQASKLWLSGKVYRDAAKVKIDPARLQAMAQQSVPLSFANRKQFETFKQELAAALKKDGIPDSLIGLSGTSTTFYSDNPTKPLDYHFDAKGPNTSDVDLFIRGPGIAKRLKGAQMNKGNYTNASVRHACPNLAAFAKKWETTLGREVNIIGKASPDTTPSRDPSVWTLHRAN